MQPFPGCTPFKKLLAYHDALVEDGNNKELDPFFYKCMAKPLKK